MREAVSAVCLPSGNWGSSHPCGNIAKCGENNVQQKKLEKQKIKRENLRGGKPKGPWLGEIGTRTIGQVRPRSLHASVRVLHGRCLGGAWYGSQPSSWVRHYMTFCSGRFWVGLHAVLVLLLFPPGNLSLVYPEILHLGNPPSFGWCFCLGRTDGGC